MTAPPHGLVWIIGASSGIGRATAKALANRGSTVIASARSEDDLKSLAQEITGSGRVIAKPVDATKKTALRKLAKTIEDDHGALDLMIYMAGYWKPMRLSNFSSSEIEKSFKVNLFGAAYAVEAVIGPMKARGRGHIVLVSSVAGYRGLPLSTAYGATKAAMTNMAESLKPDMDDAGLKLQVVSPGFVDTPMTESNPFPMPDIISAEEAAEAIVDGLGSSDFEIHFPKSFTRRMKVLRLLPHTLFFKAMRKVADRAPDLKD